MNLNSPFFPVIDKILLKSIIVLVVQLKFVVIIYFSLFYIYNKIVHNAYFIPPVLLFVEVEEIMVFFHVMYSILIDCLPDSAVLVVFVVCIFNHLIASFIHASVDFIAIVVILNFGGFEDLAIGLIFHNLRHKSVFIILRLGLGLEIAERLYCGDDIADAIGGIFERHYQTVILEDFLPREIGSCRKYIFLT